jgi:hypothetical protein
MVDGSLGGFPAIAVGCSLHIFIVVAVLIYDSNMLSSCV